MIVHPKRGASAPALAAIYVFLHLLDRSCFLCLCLHMVCRVREFIDRMLR